MTPLRLMLFMLLSLTCSIWGIVLVLDGRLSSNSYVFVVLVTAFAGILIKSCWDICREIREYRIEARKGDPVAMHNLALVLRDINRMWALEWAEKGAAKGHAPSIFLAGFLRYGMGLRDAETFDYFRRAADLGEESAMRAVADCYKFGQCVLPNDRLSFEWRLKSAISSEARRDPAFHSLFADEDAKAPGFLRSQFAVGMCYLRGEGCVKSEIEGYAWLLLASRACHTGALKKIREFERRKDYELRALIQDRCLAISEALEDGGTVEPLVSEPPFRDGSSRSVSDAKKAAETGEPIMVSWPRAFFAVFLSGNLLMGLLYLGKQGLESPLNPQVQGAVFGGLLFSAIFSASYGRKLKPLLHFILLFAALVAGAAALALWASSSVAFTIGASIAVGTIVLPASFVLMYWRHVVADCLFYALVALHLFGLATLLVK